MTEEKKMPTIEEWFEENKNENDCAGMTVGFKDFISSFDKCVNGALSGSFMGEITYEKGIGIRLMEVEVTLDLVLSKDENGKIVYFIDESRVELV